MKRELEVHHVLYRSRGSGEGEHNKVLLCRCHHQEEYRDDAGAGELLSIWFFGGGLKNGESGSAMRRNGERGWCSLLMIELSMLSPCIFLDLVIEG